MYVIVLVIIMIALALLSNTYCFFQLLYRKGLTLNP